MKLKESSKEFRKKTKVKIDGAGRNWGRRWNFACALQAQAANERIRVAFLNPDRKSEFLPKRDVLDSSRQLRRLPSVEVCWIDARTHTGNGLLLADFF
jgi:hypothetical protein